MVWARLSFDVVSSDPRVYGAVKENSEPDSSYIEFVQTTTRRRVVLAGYRLGRLLAENMPRAPRDAGMIGREKEEEARANAAEMAVIILSLLAVSLTGIIFWLVIQLKWFRSIRQACCERRAP